MVPTRGERETAHVHGTIVLQDASFTHQFADAFNGKTFLGPLQAATRRYRGELPLIIDSGPCHNLGPEGRAWLASHAHRIGLRRPAPYLSTHLRGGGGRARGCADRVPSTSVGAEPLQKLIEVVEVAVVHYYF